MKLIHVLLGFLSALLAMMLVSFFLPDAFLPTATVHPLDPNPEVASLLKSTGGLQGRPGAIWFGYAVALLITGIMATCTLLGLRKREKIGPYLPWVGGAFAAVGVAFSALTYSYSFYTEGQSEAFFAGYPAPTAWMIYGIWFLPLLVIALFIFTFDRWFLKPEDLTAFRTMVQASSEEKGGQN